MNCNVDLNNSIWTPKTFQSGGRGEDMVSVLEKSLSWCGHYQLPSYLPEPACVWTGESRVLSACVVSHSCHLSKATVMTIGKPEQFNSSCSGRLMRPLDINTCGFMLSATLFNIFSCLFPWAYGTMPCPAQQHLDLFRPEQRQGEIAKRDRKRSYIVGILFVCDYICETKMY